MNSHILTITIAVASIFCATSKHGCRAQSAISLLSGFDAERIDAAYPPTDSDTQGEIAKLLYRLRKVQPKSLTARVDGDQHSIGNAVTLEGNIERIEALTVPTRLVEFLEFSEILVIDLAVDAGTTQVLSSTFPRDAQAGDRVRGVGIVIEADNNRPVAIASEQLKWFPASPPDVGWKLLTDAGVDAAMISDLKSRDRMPLMPEDRDAFYAMLAAAGQLGQSDSLPPPVTVDPVTLLSDSQTLAGRWLRIELETVQVTRIAVTDADRQAELGSDHYYQVDAVGDLGNVVIKIEGTGAGDSPPVAFENRYPISLATAKLPEFLLEQIRSEEGGQAIVSQPRVMIAAHAFYYRLWSYDTDFMNQRGGGQQFGPLLIAAKIENRELVGADPAGVAVIGWFAAIAVIAAIAATWAWTRHVGAQDRVVRKKQQDRESERLTLP